MTDTTPETPSEWVTGPSQNGTPQLINAAKASAICLYGTRIHFEFCGEAGGNTYVVVYPSKEDAQAKYEQLTRMAHER